MQTLNLPYFDFRIEKRGDKIIIFDEIRRKWLVCTPEEWVRQNLIKFFIHTKKVPAGFIALEKEIKVYGLQKRYDALIYDKTGTPLMLIECKAPGVKISQDTFEQIAGYNIRFKVPYLFVSNGLNHYVCHIDTMAEKLKFLGDLPEYDKW
ncbi:MAG: type I restriction enzyme HsdR N-terminal domain-containing protein [Bacteroidales bacterium]